RAARALQEGAQAIRDTRLADKVAFSRQLLRGRSPEYVQAFEAQIGENVRDVAERMQNAAGALTGESPAARLERSLERLRDVVAGVEAAVGAPDAARALGARRAAAEGVRREVAEAGVDTDALDRGIDALRALEQRRGGAPQETAALQQGALERLRAFEVALAQALGREAGRPPASGGRGTVPPAFRAQVEAYYRNLGVRRLP
ncbi:MAG: hypothetical protein KJT01_08225, partial [Gemmatimonadetes bacterium]|nr:hypothetical protein [Gemmatimonadota bacterium]